MPDRRTRFEAAGRSQRSVPTTARLRDRPPTWPPAYV